jgi:hypothetical protein
VSLFPKRVCGGDLVIIHEGFSSDMPVLVSRHGYVVDPVGTRFPLADRELLCFPPRRRRRDDFFGRSPPAVFAEYLSQESAGVAWWHAFFGNHRRSTHFYAAFQVPRTARPGRYEVYLEYIANGHVQRSSTAKHDHFFVDHVCTDRLVRSRSGFRLFVENRSPEPTPARVWTPTDQLSTRYKARDLVLRPHAVTNVPVDTPKAFVTYLHQAAIVQASLNDEPFVHRNTSFAFTDLPAKRVVTLSSWRDGGRRRLELRDDARVAWLLASGTFLRSEVLARVDRSAYARLLRSRLVVEKSLGR